MDFITVTLLHSIAEWWPIVASILGAGWKLSRSVAAISVRLEALEERVQNLDDRIFEIITKK